MDLSRLKVKDYDISTSQNVLQPVSSANIGAGLILAAISASQIEIAYGNRAPHWTKCTSQDVLFR